MNNMIISVFTMIKSKEVKIISLFIAGFTVIFTVSLLTTSFLKSKGGQWEALLTNPSEYVEKRSLLFSDDPLQRSGGYLSVNDPVYLERSYAREEQVVLKRIIVFRLFSVKNGKESLKSLKRIFAIADDSMKDYMYYLALHYLPETAEQFNPGRPVSEKRFNLSILF